MRRCFLFFMLWIIKKLWGECMNPLYTIITAIISAITTIIVAYFVFKHNTLEARRRENQLSKERILMANFSVRQSAYAKVYEELYNYKKYFMKFMDEGNEFVEHEDTQNFAPLTTNTEFIDFYRKHEIWLHATIRKEFDELLSYASNLNNLALSIAMYKIRAEKGEEQEDFDYDVEGHCIGIINKINDLQSRIIQIKGLDKLDELSSIIFKSFEKK